MVLAAVLAIGLGGVAAGWLITSRDGHETDNMVPVPVVAGPDAAAPVAVAVAVPEAAPPGAPRFDIVRVGRDGNAVIAGRAQPGALVTILDGTEPLGEARVDRRGEFVFLPPMPLAPGARELRLRQTGPDGVQSDGPDQVVLVVPRRDGEAPPALALLAPREGAPRILQGPPGDLAPVTPRGAAAPGSPSGAVAPRLRLDIVDYTPEGAIRFTGKAAPGAVIRLYVDNQAWGDVTADGAGHWSFQAGEDIAAGEHRLRLDQLAEQAQVVARMELPFRREPAATVMGRGSVAGTTLSAEPRKQDGQVVVQPGDSLWVLARQTYGAGIRYMTIYAANRAQIRDPDLIYPGQIFAMPAVANSGAGVLGAAADTPAAAMPARAPGSSSASASSSRSR